MLAETDGKQNPNYGSLWSDWKTEFATVKDSRYKLSSMLVNNLEIGNTL